MDHLWLWIIATLVAFFIKGLCGFANTLVFTSVLGFGVNNVNISPVELVLGFPTNVVLTVQNRKKLNPRIYIPSIVLIVLGSIPGAFLLKNVDTYLIKIFFGIVVVFIGIDMYLRETNRLHLKESKLLLAMIGILSGMLCGLFGIGALFAAYVGRITKNSEEFKANLSVVFIAENIIRFVLYCIFGVVTISSLKTVALLIPFMIIGLFAGIKSSKILDEKIVKKLVIFALILSGIALILKTVL